MKCKNCGNDDIYFFCVNCHSRGKREKGFLKLVNLDSELLAEIKGGYRFCEYCGCKTTLDDLECKMCGHITVLF